MENIFIIVIVYTIPCIIDIIEYGLLSHNLLANYILILIMTDTKNTPQNRNKSKTSVPNRSLTDKKLALTKTTYVNISSDKKVPLVTFDCQLGKVSNINGDNDYVDDFVETEPKKPPIEYSPPKKKEAPKEEQAESSKTQGKIKSVQHTKKFQKFSKCNSENSLKKEVSSSKNNSESSPIHVAPNSPKCSAEYSFN